MATKMDELKKAVNKTGGSAAVKRSQQIARKNMVNSIAQAKRSQALTKARMAGGRKQTPTRAGYPTKANTGGSTGGFAAARNKAIIGQRLQGNRGGSQITTPGFKPGAKVKKQLY